VIIANRNVKRRTVGVEKSAKAKTGVSTAEERRKVTNIVVKSARAYMPGMQRYTTKPRNLRARWMQWGNSSFFVAFYVYSL
jgi:hypothetical protein